MTKPRSKSVVSPQQKSSNHAACNHYARGKRLLTCGLVMYLFYEVLSILNKKVLYLFADLWKMSTFASANAKTAEIAQLVEHNLAKVGVASSSLVFRSHTRCAKRKFYELVIDGEVAELVDALL